MFVKRIVYGLGYIGLIFELILFVVMLLRLKVYFDMSHMN